MNRLTLQGRKLLQSARPFYTGYIYSPSIDICTIAIKNIRIIHTIPLKHKFSSKVLKKFIKRYKVKKKMQIFYDISNLLTTFQMSQPKRMRVIKCQFVITLCLLKTFLFWLMEPIILEQNCKKVFKYILMGHS